MDGLETTVSQARRPMVRCGLSPAESQDRRVTPGSSQAYTALRSAAIAS